MELKMKVDGDWSGRTAQGVRADAWKAWDVLYGVVLGCWAVIGVLIGVMR